MRIFATYSIKGGVGKTATAVNLSFLSALGGERTLVWDLDPQAAATFYFRIKAKVKGGAKKLLSGKSEIDSLIRGTDFDRLDLLPADFSYRNLDVALEGVEKPTRRLASLLMALDGEYDNLFLDCAPSISLTSESIFVAADVLLVPTIPTTLSLRTLAQLRRHLDKHGPKRLAVFPFFCLVDRRKALHREICAAGRAEGAYEFLDTQIPYASQVEQMGVHRAPLSVFARGAVATRAYEELWREVCRRMAERDAGR